MSYFAQIHAAQEAARERAEKRAIARAAYRLEHALYVQEKEAKEQARRHAEDAAEMEKWVFWASDIFAMNEAEQADLWEELEAERLEAWRMARDAKVHDLGYCW